MQRNTNHHELIQDGGEERERDEGQIYPKIENKGRRMKTKIENSIAISQFV